MVELVFFGEELCDRAPVAVGCLYDAGRRQWVSMLDVAATIQANTPILIRPATGAEMRRAEGLCALFEIGQQLGGKIDQLLDHQTPEALQAYKEELAARISSFGPVIPLLDREEQQARASAGLQG